jgi:lipopolysaccharide biosynthesis regulator YciM
MNLRARGDFLRLIVLFRETTEWKFAIREHEDYEKFNHQNEKRKINVKKGDNAAETSLGGN